MTSIGFCILLENNEMIFPNKRTGLSSFSGRLIARKELRKATRISDIPSLEAAVRKFKHLQMVEEDGDFSAAVEVLRNLLDKKGNYLKIKFKTCKHFENLKRFA